MKGPQKFMVIHRRVQKVFLAVLRLSAGYLRRFCIAPKWFSFVLVWMLCSFHSLCATAYAQQHPIWSSIDLRVAQADHVVIGHIAEMGEASGNAERNERSQLIVLAVEETVKGEPVSRLPFTVFDDLWNYFDSSKLLCGICAEHSHRLLVAIGHRQNYPSIVYAVDLEAKSVMDITGDLHLLTTGTAVAQAAREEARRCPGVLDDKHVGSSGPSDTLMKGTLFQHAEMYVPIDERQEKLAQKVLSSQPDPAAILGYRTNDRYNAVKVLAFFRSPQNIKILKTQLNDPEIEHEPAGILVYPIRELAYGNTETMGRRRTATHAPEDPGALGRKNAT